MSKWMPGRLDRTHSPSPKKPLCRKSAEGYSTTHRHVNKFNLGADMWRTRTSALHGPGPDSGRSHPTCMATLPSQLSLTVGNAVLFTPFDGHLPKFDLLEPIPSVPQVVFGE